MTLSSAPSETATCMYYAGIDPFFEKPVQTARNLRDCKLQRALMQFFKLEDYFEVREALIKADRSDLDRSSFKLGVTARSEVANSKTQALP
jgi:hypothetical protein